MIYSTPYKNKIRPKVIRDAIKRFDDDGRSGPHSEMGAILCHVLNDCIKRRISFELNYLSGGGYYLKRVDLCLTCHKIMDTGLLQDTNCGGDCTACMADAGDPGCIETMKAVKEIESHNPIQEDGQPTVLPDNI